MAVEPLWARRRHDMHDAIEMSHAACTPSPSPSPYFSAMYCVCMYVYVCMEVLRISCRCCYSLLLLLEIGNSRKKHSITSTVSMWACAGDSEPATVQPLHTCLPVAQRPSIFMNLNLFEVVHVRFRGTHGTLRVWGQIRVSLDTSLPLVLLHLVYLL